MDTLTPTLTQALALALFLFLTLALALALTLTLTRQARDEQPGLYEVGAQRRPPPVRPA